MWLFIYCGNIFIVGVVSNIFPYTISYLTYHAATGEHDSEPVDDARRADHPR